MNLALGMALGYTLANSGDIGVVGFLVALLAVPLGLAVGFLLMVGLAMAFEAWNNT